ncbi:MAG: tetratricopeptide repeat protein [Phocaeicola sp.]
MDNSSDYNLGLQELINRYEGMVNSHTPLYFDSQELLKIYEYYKEQEREEDALRLILDAFELYPNDLEIAIAYIDEVINGGDIEEALRVAFRTDFEQSQELTLLQGELMLVMHKINEAEALFEKVALEAEYDVEVLLDILTCYTKSIYVERADKYVQLLQEKHPFDSLVRSNKEVRDSLANYYMLTDQNIKSYELSRLETDIEPYSHEAWGELAVGLALEEKYTEAIEAIDFALAIEPTNNDLIEIKLSILAEFSTHQEIVTFLRKHIQENGESLDAVFQLIEYYIGQKRYDEAYFDCQGFLKLEGITSEEQLKLLLKISQCAVLGSQEKRSHQYALLAMQGYKKSYQPYAHYGFCWLNFKEPNLELATYFFQKSLSYTTTHDYPKALLEIGIHFFEAGWMDRAIPYFELTMHELGKEKVRAYIYLIYCHFCEFNVDKAIDCLKKLRSEHSILYLRFEEMIESIDTLGMTEGICKCKELIDKGITDGDL